MAQIEIKNFDSPDESPMFRTSAFPLPSNGRRGQVVGKAVFEPGWKWSETVKPIAGTDSCQVSHLGYVISGRMSVYMDDGSEARSARATRWQSRPGRTLR